MISQRELAELSVSELRALISTSMSVLKEKLLRSDDVTTCVEAAMQQSFHGDAMRDPFMLSSYLVIPGKLTRLTSTKHKCVFCTVQLPGEDHLWAWDDAASTLIDTESSDIGASKCTVALHVPPDSGMTIMQHTMTWDGERHTRSQVKVWQVLDGVVRQDFGYKAPSLPPPHGGQQKHRNRK